MRLDELVSLNYEKFNSTDKHIAKYVMNQKELIPFMNIDVVAQKCSVSKSTVMRFAQKLNLHGFSELKTIIRLDTEQISHVSADIVKTTCQFNIQMIELLQKIDCTAICKSLHLSKRIFVYGTGSMQKAASLEFKRLFLSSGIIIDYISGESELTKTTKLLTDSDTILIISRSGDSLFIESICDVLNLHNVNLISFTFSGNNYLANHSNHRLFLQKHEVAIDKDIIFKSNAIIFTAMEILYAKYIHFLSDSDFI